MAWHRATAASTPFAVPGLGTDGCLAALVMNTPDPARSLPPTLRSLAELTPKTTPPPSRPASAYHPLLDESCASCWWRGRPQDPAGSNWPWPSVGWLLALLKRSHQTRGVALAIKIALIAWN